MTHDYLPKKPPPLPRQQVPSHVRKLAKSALVVLGKLLWLHQDQPAPAIDALPAMNGDLAGEQRQQCREAYDGSLDRIAAVENRASSLVQTVVILVPLALAAWAFLWKNSPALHPWLFRTVLVICLLSLISALGAVVAALRAGSVFPIQSPGPESLFDLEKGERREYSAERDAYCLVWCAWMNHALADHRLDFIRAGQVLTSAALSFLLVSSIFLVPVSSAVFTEPGHTSDIETLRDTVAAQSEMLKVLSALANANAAAVRNSESQIERGLAKITLTRQQPTPEPQRSVSPGPGDS